MLSPPAPPPRLPPSGAQIRGQRQVERAQAARAGETTAQLGLREASDGGYLYADPGGRFKAHIAGDGAVTFANRWRQLARRRRVRNRERGVCCGTPAGGLGPAINVLGGAPVAGPTEWAFGVRGHDPAGAAKAGFLTRTAALRTKLAHQDMRRQMGAALDRLEDALVRLWADPDIDLARKRALLFARWDGLADAPPLSGGVSDLDRLRASYAQRARRRIEAFVRRELPRGTANAFSAAELQHLNASRRAPIEFAPYRQERHDG